MILYTDGTCWNNHQPDPQLRVMGAVVCDADGTCLSHNIYKGGSNNIAELLAILDALVRAKVNGWSDLEVRMDSTIAITWLEKEICQDVTDFERVSRIKEMIVNFRTDINLQLVWVPRKENVAGIYIQKQGK